MPSESSLISASMLICASVLEETNGIRSAIRIMDTYKVLRDTRFVPFFVLTMLRCTPGDYYPHTVVVRMITNVENEWKIAASTDDYRFVYGYKRDPRGPGGLSLATNFNFDLTALPFPALRTYYMQAWLDGEMVTQTPFTLHG